jgi:hypothetical protein
MVVEILTSTSATTEGLADLTDQVRCRHLNHNIIEASRLRLVWSCCILIHLAAFASSAVVHPHNNPGIPGKCTRGTSQFFATNAASVNAL